APPPPQGTRKRPTRHPPTRRPNAASYAPTRSSRAKVSSRRPSVRASAARWPSTRGRLTTWTKAWHRVPFQSLAGPGRGIDSSSGPPGSCSYPSQRGVDCARGTDAESRKPRYGGFPEARPTGFEPVTFGSEVGLSGAVGGGGHGSVREGGG